MFQIGEFSKITGLTIKSLRLYHEKGILVPKRINPQTDYRYYDERNAEKARAIQFLKEMTFSLKEIKEILNDCTDETDIVVYLEQKLEHAEAQRARLESVSKSLKELIQKEREVIMTLEKQGFEVEEKVLDELLIASIRWRGRYDECGEPMGRLCKKMARFACGKPINLYYDAEYKEQDADIETAIPVRKGKPIDDIAVRPLPGGKAVTLIHKGPYDTISASYQKIFAHIEKNNLQFELPLREVYLKGPGMILRGNPKNYLTEIQILLK